jgi:predicted ATPase
MDMITKTLTFDLPIPWAQKKFETSEIGPINFLVGPNGSGKSKFAATLRSHLDNARMLGTDRLSGMEQTNVLRSFLGDHLQTGFPKNFFAQIKAAGVQGAGMDAFMLLEERMDLRIRVEATLSHLFNRKIILDWDSGNLVARAILGETGQSYRFDRDECHGIKELLVLLTHLYNDQHSQLIIDEPELNLHPQYQAFFMQEVRKAAGDPTKDRRKKIIFLVTHSPFILDFRSAEDVKSVISFDLTHSVPKHIFNLDQEATERLSKLVPRLNVHHKQLFFSDNPIFVEGILDAQLISAMQDARGESVAAAGSCIIDAGGCEEVNRYLELCSKFGKRAHFLYDLDSLFGGNLRGCLRGDGPVQSFLATAGVGNDFSKYCGELDRKLTQVIDHILSLSPAPKTLSRLFEFLRGLGQRAQWDPASWKKARVSILTTMSRDRASFIAGTSQEDTDEIEGRLRQIVGALKQRNISVLPGGTLERYLPSYTGDPYELSDEAKRKAVEGEVEELAKPMSSSELANRYGDLYQCICALPSKPGVDIDRVLRGHLSLYIHELQGAVANHPTWELAQVQAHMNAIAEKAARVFSIREMTRGGDKEFSSVVMIAETLDGNRRLVRVTHQTNAGMGEFTMELA